METLRFENRAWRGTRLVSDELAHGQDTLVFEVGYHYPQGQYYVEVEVTEPAEKNGLCPTYGKTVDTFFADPYIALAWIGHNYKVSPEYSDPLIRVDEEAIAE